LHFETICISAAIKNILEYKIVAVKIKLIIYRVFLNILYSTLKYAVLTFEKLRLLPEISGKIVFILFSAYLKR